MESGDGAVESTTVVIAGGGPAGMMAGLLLARAGIAVTVLEPGRTTCSFMVVPNTSPL